MNDINVTFCRRLLTQAHDQIREAFPGVKVADPHVVGCVGPSCGQYFVELRVPSYPDFDRYYSADNKYEAKAKAWFAFYEKYAPEQMKRAAR